MSQVKGHSYFNKGFNKEGTNWRPHYTLTYAERKKAFLEEVEKTRPLHNGLPNPHAYFEDGEWHLPLMWGKPGHFGAPQPKYVTKVYDDMIRNESILRTKQIALKKLASEVETKRKAVVAARLTHVNKGFKKPDGGPIRNQSLFTGQMNVNKGFISPGTVITFEKDNKFTANTYVDNCNECLDKGECGSCDGCCNCICHKGTRQDYYRKSLTGLMDSCYRTGFDL